VGSKRRRKHKHPQSGNLHRIHRCSPYPSGPHAFRPGRPNGGSQAYHHRNQPYRAVSPESRHLLRRREHQLRRQQVV